MPEEFTPKPGKTYGKLRTLLKRVKELEAENKKLALAAYGGPGCSCIIHVCELHGGPDIARFGHND